MKLQMASQEDVGLKLKCDQPSSVMAGGFPVLEKFKNDLDKCALAAAALPDIGEFERIYIFAAIRRTLSLIVAFRQSIEVGNEQMAATILRLNLDTVARFYALFWADETEGMSAESFSKEVFNGAQIRHMKLRNQVEKATDYWLIKQIEPLQPWIRAVYENTSGAVHFSGFHMERVLQQVERNWPCDEGGVEVFF